MHGAGNAALRSKAANQLAIYIYSDSTIWHEISFNNKISTNHEIMYTTLHVYHSTIYSIDSCVGVGQQMWSLYIYIYICISYIDE